ncbi:MAG: hypothetical protein AAF677_11930 [Pseudomonadota bacterium]
MTRGADAGTVAGDGGPTAELMAVVAEGVALVDEERVLCRRGALARIEGLAAAKTAYLTRLEAAMTAALPGAARDPAVRRALARLGKAAAANERLILAAREGVRRARRCHQDWEALRTGAVAYAADGTAILSREDAAGKTKTA